MLTISQAFSMQESLQETIIELDAPTHDASTEGEQEFEVPIGRGVLGHLMRYKGGLATARCLRNIG